MKTTIYFLLLLPLIVLAKPSTNFETYNKSIKFTTSILGTAPKSIAGLTTICKGSITSLTAVGATLSSGDTFQWGTGTTIGSNISGQSSVTISITPMATTTYWVRVVSSSGVATSAASVTVNITVANPSTAPTSILATTAICNGSSTTLSAVGAILSSGAVYQWGMGTTIGTNVIIGQTGATISVTPTGTTAYWVRVIDAAPCSNISTGVSTAISLVYPSTAPTVITGTTTVCLGSATILVATGGYGATGSTYQWGTGSVVGSNIISGEVLQKIAVAPTTDTNYWVRRIDNGSCTSATGSISTIVNVNIPAGNQTTYGNNSWIGYVYANHNTIANPIVEDVFAANYRGYLTQNENFDVNFPSCVISGDNICGTYNVKYAVRFKMTKNFTAGYYNFFIGGDDGVRLSIDGGATYLINEWNVQAYTTGTATVYLSGNTNLVLEYFQGPLSNARVSFAYTACSISEAPTAIAGNTASCSGSSTTLTATGGFEGIGSTYQWGTGSVVGSNVITGQTLSSITVSPSNTTSYWVRRISAAPCSSITSGISTTVTTTPKSTVPTWISGSISLCLGYGTTLTANGGTVVSGCTYQWGTGSVIGSNIISGQTAQAISVTPTSTTTYWVRRLDNGVCTSFTDAISTVVTVATPPGNPAVFGDNQWNVYGYSTGDITLASALYSGNYTLNSLDFDTQTGTNSWSYSASPSSVIGWAGCPVPNDNFTYALKRKGFACGNYTLKLLNWDDEAKVFINGIQVWSADTWSGTTTSTSGAVIGSFNLDGNSTIEVRVREYYGNSNASLAFTNNSVFVPSSGPTTINGTASICNGTSTTLTASGGTMSASGSYQWGTGSTVGSNIIVGQTAASITVTPISDTVYWARRVDSVCNNITAGVTKTVSLISSVGGTLSTNQNICVGANASDIVLTGNVGNVVNWQKSNDATFATFTDIANTATTLLSSTIGLLSTTTYYRAVVANGSCSSAFSATSVVIVAPAAVGGTIGGSAIISSGSNAVLVLTNKVGNIVKWQSSTTPDFSSSVSDIADTTSSLTTPSLTTTTYYRVVVQSGVCSSAYSSIGAATLENPSTAPTSITGTTAVCKGTSTTLTAFGGILSSAGSYQWGTGSMVGSNIIAGKTAASITVNLFSDTIYWVRRVDSDRKNSTGGVTQMVSVTISPVGGSTSAKQDVCAGTSVSDIVLTGNVGNVVKWQKSNDATFATATDIATTATRLLSSTIGLLYAETYFRAVVANGSCSSAFSSVSRIVVAPASVGGIMNGSGRICSGSNTTLILSNRVGSIIKWQSSTASNFSSNVSDIANTTQSLTTPSLTTTTYYRAVVQSGACLPVYSPIGEIEIAVPSVRDTQCGTTLVNLDSSIYPNPMVGAQAYKFQVTNGSNVRVYEPTTPLFNLTQLPGSANYDTTYLVQIAVKRNDVWSAFGSLCEITTPSPITKVKAQFCGTTLATIITSIYADALIGVQGYRFEVTDGTNVRTFDAPSNLFNLTQLTAGASYGTTYTIRVAVNVNGVWGAYGATSNVATPIKTIVKQTAKQAARPVTTVAIIEYTVKAYPNPFSGNFKFLLTSPSEDTVEVSVYDLLGRMITCRKVKAADINTVELGEEYSAGTYNVIIRQGNDVKTLRMIKR